MKLQSLFLIMVRYLFAKGPERRASLKRIRGGLVGIAISLVPLVVVYQVDDGMIEGISARFIETSSYHLQAYPMDGKTEEDFAAVSEELRSLPGVSLVSRELNGLAILASDSGSSGVTIRAVEPALAGDPGFRRYMTVQEGELDFGDPEGVVLGGELARELGVRVGDRVRVITAKGFGASLLPRVSPMRVKGIASSGYQTLDRLWLFMPLEKGIRILPGDGSAQFIGIKTVDPYLLPNPLAQRSRADLPDLAGEINAVFGYRWQVHTWYQLGKSQFLNFMTTRNLLLFIMVLIVVIASVNVSSTMIMLVLEKQQEIAILKSVGAKPGGLVLIFMAAGGLTGTIGAVFGLSLGALLSVFVNEIIGAAEVLVNGLLDLFRTVFSSGQKVLALKLVNPAFYLERIPINLKAADFALIFGLTVLLSLLASFFPARRAAKLKPLEVMRKV